MTYAEELDTLLLGKLCLLCSYLRCYAGQTLFNMQILLQAQAKALHDAGMGKYSLFKQRLLQASPTHFSLASKRRTATEVPSILEGFVNILLKRFCTYIGQHVAGEPGDWAGLDACRGRHCDFVRDGRRGGPAVPVAAAEGYRWHSCSQLHPLQPGASGGRQWTVLFLDRFVIRLFFHHPGAVEV